MASKDLVSEEVLQELTNKIQETINNYCWNIEHFTDDEVEGFFDGTQQEIDYYNSLIKDDVVSKNFLHSSKQIADDIAQSILEANEYTDSLLKNISSIQLKYVTSLPTSDISEHTIYILKASDSSSKDTLNLYNATDGWTSIGDFSISLDDYYTKNEIDTKMDLKANKTEVVANDKIVQTLGSTTNSSDTILSTSGLQAELDKKANDDEVVKKTDTTTTIGSTSTDSELPTAKSVWDSLYKICDPQILVDANKPTSRICEADLTTLNTPSKEGLTIAQASLIISANDHDCWNGQISITVAEPSVYVRSVNASSTWTKWQRLCSTSVADVPLKTLTNSSDIKSDAVITYIVKNGMCTVSANTISSTKMSTGNITLTTGLPTPANPSCWYSLCTNSNATSAPLQNLLVRVDASGNLISYIGTNSVNYFGSFSYPVAEE